MYRLRKAFCITAAILLLNPNCGFCVDTPGDSLAPGAAEPTANIIARIDETLARHFESLAKLAQDPELAAALTSRDDRALEDTATRFLKNFDGGLRLRIFYPGQAALATTESPPLTYAALDAIQLAEKSTQPVAAEMIMPGTPTQHILLVQRVSDVHGALSGVLALHLAPDLVLRSLSPNLPTSTVMEIHQVVSGSADTLIASNMPAKVLSNAASKRLSIPHSRWSLYVWSAGQRTAGSVESEIPTATIVAAVAGAVGLAVIAWYIRRKRRFAVKKITRSSVAMPLTVQTGSNTDVLNARLEQTEQKVNSFGASHQIAVVESTDVQPISQREETMHSTASADSPGAVPDSVFRAYDIRGIVGEGLTEDTVYLLGRALGSEAHERGQQEIVVARDGRSSGPALSEALKKGLLESGRDVIDIGMVPTPVLYWATYFLETHSGVMLTGSHNPANYNGLKIVLDGRALAGEAITAIRDRIKRRDFTSGHGKLQTADLGADYIRRITDDIPVALSRAFKVIVDCGNGVPGVLAPKLIRALGHDVVELYCNVDGSFPNHHPDPSQPENLHDLIALVKQENADLGLAFDGDGDRLGVVDAEGNIVWPDRQMMLFARDVLSRNAGAEIIFDVKCSNHLPQVISECGGRPLMWKTGHSLIKSKMRESGAPLAGEMSGHIFFKERWYGFDDALYAAARLLEILVKDRRSPSEVFADLPGGVATPELRLDMPETQHAKFMQKLIELADFGTQAQLTTVDGLRVDFPDRWALVRSSNTTPCLILRFEADNHTALKQMQEQFRQLLNAVQPGLHLPF